jgi:hypothetical protein
MGDAVDSRPAHPAHTPVIAARIARLQAQAQSLILMKETGPKSAAWHRARVRTLWCLQQQIAELESRSKIL